MNRSVSRLALVAVIAAAPLAGCGKMGQLERPGPLFGQARATAKPGAATEAQDPSSPVKTIDPRDRSTELSPPRTSPIEGTSPDPFATAPKGALPDPYANPQ